MKYLLIVPFLAFALFSSCKKDDPQVTSSPIELEFGNTTNMDIQTFNKTIHLYDQDSINIDVNNNGSTDLKFSIWLYTTGSARDRFGVIMYSPSKEIAVNGFFMADTTYYFESTSIHADTNSTKVWVTNTSNYNCYRLSSSDMISKTISPNFKMFYYNNSDKLYLQDTYSTEFDFPIWQGKSGGVPYVTSISGDTTYLATSSYGQNCHSIGVDEKYIGFKDNSTQKLGWIKLKYNTMSAIEVIEVAIQK